MKTPPKGLVLGRSALDGLLSSLAKGGVKVNPVLFFALVASLALAVYLNGVSPLLAEREVLVSEIEARKRLLSQRDSLSELRKTEEALMELEAWVASLPSFSDPMRGVDALYASLVGREGVEEVSLSPASFSFPTALGLAGYTVNLRFEADGEALSGFLREVGERGFRMVRMEVLPKWREDGGVAFSVTGEFLFLVASNP